MEVYIKLGNEIEMSPNVCAVSKALALEYQKLIAINSYFAVNCESKLTPYGSRIYNASCFIKLSHCATRITRQHLKTMMNCIESICSFTL